MLRTSLITGVSRGLGAALFAQLHDRGDRVVGIGRSFTVEQRELARAEPQRVVLREANLADPATLPDRDELAGWLAGAGWAALVHNAGVVDPIGAVGELPPDQLATAVTVNLTAPMLLTNAFLAALPEQARAALLFVSSGAARRVIGGWAVYSATKRGGEAFFEMVAAQVGGDGRITVASANPGVMDTGMQAAIRGAAAGRAYFPDRERFLALPAEGGLQDPVEVARRFVAEHLSG